MQNGLSFIDGSFDCPKRIYNLENYGNLIEISSQSNWKIVQLIFNQEIIDHITENSIKYKKDIWENGKSYYDKYSRKQILKIKPHDPKYNFIDPTVNEIKKYLASILIMGGALCSRYKPLF